jgi:hypothetical protein
MINPVEGLREIMKINKDITHIGSAISIETPPVGFFLKFSNV